MSKAKSDVVEAFTRKMLMVNTAYRQFIQCKFREHNIALTFEMLQVMACLWNQDGINQQDIANITVKDKASMTYLIDNLTRRGLVTRLEDAADRRNKLIMLTPEGRQMKAKVQPFISEMFMASTRNIDIDMLKQTMALLDAVETNLRS